jgi:uncharacterized membrane protein YhaH (DUF805 family)
VRWAEQSLSAGTYRRTRWRLLPRRAASALIVCSASLLWMIVSVGVTPASAAAATGHGPRTTTTQTTTPFSRNTAIRGHKEGPLAIALSIIGVIVVVALIVGLGSISVRRRTRDNPTPGWWRDRAPPDHRKGLFG